MKLLNLSAVIGIVVNLLVNFILIPRYHACGAAVASLSTQTVMACIQTVIAFRIIDIPLKEIPFIKCLLFLAIVVPGVGLFAHYFQGEVVIALVISGIFAFLAGFATRLVPLKFWEVWRKE